MRVIVQIRRHRQCFQVLAAEDVDEGFDMTVFISCDRYYLSLESVQKELEYFMGEPVNIIPVVITAGAILHRSCEALTE